MTSTSEKRHEVLTLAGENIKEEGSLMWRHSCDRHERNVPNFVMNVSGTFRDEAMLRQVTESIMINKIDEKKLINSKNE